VTAQCGCGALVDLCNRAAATCGNSGVRRDNRGDVPQHVSAECLSLRRQTTLLIVCELQPCGAELFPHGAVLVLEVVDDVALLPVDPTASATGTNRNGYDG
jgi:hypothetical protein